MVIGIYSKCKGFFIDLYCLLLFLFVSMFFFQIDYSHPYMYKNSVVGTQANSYPNKFLQYCCNRVIFCHLSHLFYWYWTSLMFLCTYFSQQWISFFFFFFGSLNNYGYLLFKIYQFTESIKLKCRLSNSTAHSIFLGYICLVGWSATGVIL